MLKSHYWLIKHVWTILGVLLLLFLVASFTLSEGRIRRFRDHTAYEARVETLALKKPISTQQKGTTGTSDLKNQLKKQQQTQDELLNVHTNPYNDDQASKAQLVKDNQKVLSASQKSLQKQQTVAGRQQKVIAQRKNQQEKIQTQKQQRSAQAKKTMRSLVHLDAGMVFVKVHDKASLQRGIDAYQDIDKNDPDYATYTHIKERLQQELAHK